MLIVHGFASDIANTDFAVLSGLLIPIFAIVVLTNLYTAGIIDTIPGFSGGSLHSLSTCLFPGMQVTLLFMGLGVGFRAFCLVMTADVLLHLNSGLLSSVQISCFTTPGSSLLYCQSFLMLSLLGGLVVAL
jgi:hypothetical protein